MIHLAPEPGGRQAFDAFWRSLLVAHWESATGPMRFSPNLALSDLTGADFFQNTRGLLAALAAENGAPATATGNLNRAFIALVLDRLTLPAPYRDSLRKVCKVMNEHDVWPLHLLRVVAECAGLVVRRNKRFQLTRTGKAALADDQAGVLYRRLFLAYFRRFDLHYDFHLRNVPGIQQTMAVILWRLDTVARDWTPVRGLAPQVLLPGVLQQLHAAMTSTYDTEEWILGGYVLDPLFDLGLIERKNPSGWPSVTKEDDDSGRPLVAEVHRLRPSTRECPMKPWPSAKLGDELRPAAHEERGEALFAEVDALKRLQAETTAELDAVLPAISDKAFKGEL